MPITRPSRSSRGPPELPGLTAASIWMRPSMGLPPVGGLNDRSRPEMTPDVIDPASPNGLPTTKASSPIRAPCGSPSVAGGMLGGIVSGWRTAMSFSGCRATIWAGDSEPSTKVTVIEAASSTTWRLVRMSPRSSTMTPVPIASSWLGDGLGPVGAIAVWIRTTDGRARSYAIEEKAGGGVIDASTSWTPVRTSAGVSARGPGAMTPNSHMPRNAATMPETKGADRRRFARARRQRLRQGRSGGVGWMTAGSNMAEPRMTALEALASWLAVYGEMARLILRGSPDEARRVHGGTRARVEWAPSPVLSSLAPKDPGG